jgi:hypothetical protein
VDTIRLEFGGTLVPKLQTARAIACSVVPVLVPPNKNSCAPTMLDWNQCPTVERVPGKVSGVWLFRGARASEGSFRESRRRRQCGRFPAVVSGREAAGARGP